MTIITTWSGRNVDLRDIDPESIHVEDIARSLSMQCRYSGHVDKFYSVAEHCVLLARHFRGLPSSDSCRAFDALLHDAAEAYIGDIAAPVKTLLRLGDPLTPAGAAVERVEDAVARRFGLRWPVHHAVAEADRQIQWDEYDELFAPRFGPALWAGHESAPRLGAALEFLDPAAAEAAFLSLFRELSEDRGQA